MEFYAKSSPIETVSEHTKELLERLKIYKDIYAPSLTILSGRDWELLEWAVKYHDVGKVDTFFQNKIRKNIGLSSLPVASSYDIPHNFLSVMAISFKKLGFNDEESKLVAQVVAFHHERGSVPDKQQIAANYKENILPHKDKIEQQLNLLIDDKCRASKINKIGKRFLPTDPMYYRYILLKGILHRLDHAASAHVPIELSADMGVSSHVNSFFLEKLKKPKKDLQLFTESHQHHHLVIVAQTGMGKTEAGLLWLGNKKGFFTLPLRVSINAMYSRIINKENIGFSKKGDEMEEEATGLLHATSLDYLYDQEEGNDQILEKMHSQSKEFANKLIITTIDQILKFPFLYLGFEKEYATMATSKVIIDELQAYDPKIAAVLIRALTMIDKIGGSFMIMTATLPGFYYDALKQELSTSNHEVTYKEFIDDSVRRHNVALRKHSIMEEEMIEEISSHANSKKILVICNTVDRACEVFEKIQELKENVKLLHSRFTKKDRSLLEKQIIEFANSDDNGIWVTTQLVEASLDIDFDMLFTEMSSLDSQFQRFGRCNRKGLKPVNEVNVQICTEDVSGVGSVYHQDIFNKSLELLMKQEKGLMLESVKQEMIKVLYDKENLKNSTFYMEFKDALDELKIRPHYDPDLKKGKAQDLLRDIQQVQVIPIEFTEQEEFQEKLTAWKESASKEERRRFRNEIESYSVSIRKYKANGLPEVEGIKGLYYIYCQYSSEKGLMLNQEVYAF